MCVTSCAMYSKVCLSCAVLAFSGSAARTRRRYVIAAGFSIAPALKSGSPMPSIFRYGYGTPVYISSQSSASRCRSREYTPSRDMPRGSHTRHGTPLRVRTGSVASMLPTQKVRRYDDSGGVSAKRHWRRPPGSSSVDSTGPLATAAASAGPVTASAKGALKVGSSKHGKARRASAGASCVAAMRCSPSVDR